MPGSTGNKVLVWDDCHHKKQPLSVGFLCKRVVLKQGFDLEPPNFTWPTIQFKTFIYGFDKTSKCSIVLLHDQINLEARGWRMQRCGQRRPVMRHTPQRASCVQTARIYAEKRWTSTKTMTKGADNTEYVYVPQSLLVYSIARLP